jgi:hypothetical protein
MSQPHQVHQHPASVDAYIRHGFSLVPIPAGTKGPKLSGWNVRENALKSQADVPAGHGIGLAHAYSGTCALDIDDWDTAAFMLGLQGVDIRALYEANDAVVIDSGKAGRGKLLYALKEPLRTKKITTSGQTSYELRCATANGLTVQDVLPPSIHPETRQPYRWAGRGHWSRLPAIPAVLLQHWQSLLKDDEVKTIAEEGSTLDLSWSEIQRALSHINADCDRQAWVNIGMALHWAGTQSGNLDTAFSMWVEWSMGAAHRFPGNREMFTQWRSFKADKESGIKIGTLFAAAKAAGYIRPVPDVTHMFSEVKKTAGSLMQAFRPAPPDVDLSVFPDVLSRRAQEVATGIGCDPVIPLWAGISAVCAVVDARTRLELAPGYEVPPVLWMMTIGNPGDMKTPGSKPMLSLLKDLEKEDTVNYAPAMLMYEAAEAQYNAAHKNFLEVAKSAEALLPGAELPHVPPLPVAPVPLKLSVSDVTSQRLVRIVADRPRGVLCHLDEMNSWVKGMTDKASGENRSTWVEAQGAGTYDMERVGTGNTHAENFAVSIYGNIQPAIFHQNLESLTSDGLLQRFVPCVIRARNWGVGKPVPDFLSNKQSYEQTLRLIHSLEPRKYKLDTEALALFKEFQEWYRATQEDIRITGENMMYRHAFAKIEGILGRFILIDHLVADPFSLQVKIDSVKRMIQFIKGYVLPSYRYTYGEFSGVDTFDRWVTEFVIRNSDKSVITLHEIKSASRAQRKGMSNREVEPAIIGAMDLLESYGWVMASSKARDNASWVVNPALTSEYAAQREATNQAKKRQMDEFCTRK